MALLSIFDRRMAMRTSALILLVTAGFAFADDKVNDQTVAATVNGEAIKLADLDKVFRMKPKGGPPLTASMVRDLRRAAVEDLIDDALIRQFLSKQKITVEPKEIDEQIKLLVESLTKRGESFVRYLADSGQSESQAREQFAMLIGFEKFVDAAGTDAELHKFFDLHREFFEKVRVHSQIRMVRVPRDATAAEKATAKQKLIQTGGESYRPERPNGDVGWLTKFDTPVEEVLSVAAFGLKPGESSEPIEISVGYARVTCLERSSPKPVTFEEVSEWVRDTYANQLRKVVVARMRKEAMITISIP
jgi:parvulin-like peptidyl-prolyl isomerase